MKSSIYSICLFWILYFPVYGQEQFPKGVVIDEVLCLEDSTQAYALYLPSSYNKNRMWPIVYFFDPIARGTVPVKIFQSAAEQFGLILVGSNISRNGPWEHSFGAAEAMFLDTQTRFNIDRSQLFLSGFSGGSRVSTAIASLTEQFAGVIACGAGLPQVKEYQPKMSSSFAYVGFVGTRDPNFVEMMDLHSSLANQNAVIITDDPHVWPNGETAMELIQWMLALTDNLTEAGREIFYRERFVQLQEEVAEREMIYLILELRSLLASRLETNDTFEANRLLDSLTALKDFKSTEKQWQKLIDQEREKKQEFADALRETGLSGLIADADGQLITLDWWKLRVKALKKGLLNKSLVKRDHSYRLLETIYVESIEQSNAYENRGDLELAIKLNEVAVMAKDDSPYPAWNLARLLAKINRVEHSLEYLRDALDKGMKKVESLDYPEFDALRGEKEFQRILDALE